MRAFLTVEQCQKADELTQKFFKLSSFELMQKVAKEMAHQIMSRWEPAFKFLILVGPGNNGGDGYCVAEYMRVSGYDVAVLPVFTPATSDAKKAFKLFKGKTLSLEGHFLNQKKCIIIDAVFGLKGRSQLPPVIAQLFKCANQSGVQRIALDSPSGINLETEDIDSHAFCADLTLTVGFFKSAFLNPKILNLCGEVQVVSRDFVEPKLKQEEKLLGLEWSDHRWGRRSNFSHKGSFGRVAIVGGSSPTPGAPFLAAEAAGRSGAGYVSVFFDSDRKISISIKDASFILKTKWSEKDLKSQDAFVLGCGGFNKKSRVYFKPEHRCVWDADSLSSLTSFGTKKPQWILTPHPGEAAKLLKTATKAVTDDPLGSAQRIVKKTGASVYLKGAPGYLVTAVSGIKNIYYVNLSSNHVFARAGSGDILSGIMGTALLKTSSELYQCAIDALLLQRAIGEVLRGREGLWTHDQLEVFSEAFKLLRRRANQESQKI